MVLALVIAAAIIPPVETMAASSTIDIAYRLQDNSGTVTGTMTQNDNPVSNPCSFTLDSSDYLTILLHNNYIACSVYLELVDACENSICSARDTLPNTITGQRLFYFIDGLVDHMPGAVSYAGFCNLLSAHGYADIPSVLNITVTGWVENNEKAYVKVKFNNVKYGNFFDTAKEEIKTLAESAGSQSASENQTVTLTSKEGLALDIDIMNILKNAPGVTLDYTYTYLGNDYHVVIPGGDSVIVDESIPWYGPLWLAAHYSADAQNEDTVTGDYTILRGDTLGKIAKKYGTTVASLLKLNPSITNANRIFAGTTIRIAE